ncbi:MAG: hypothetical protein ACREUG_07295 [Steroidobacteraceae bacterium]
MAGQSQRPDRVGRSRRRAASARASPGSADVLGRFSDALSLRNVAQNSLSAKEIPGTGDEVVAIRHAADALKIVYDSLDRLPKPPGTG